MNRDLLIVGAEDQCNALKKIAESMGCFEKIEFIGDEETDDRIADSLRVSAGDPHGPLAFDEHEYCFEDGM